MAHAGSKVDTNVDRDRAHYKTWLNCLRPRALQYHFPYTLNLLLLFHALWRRKKGVRFAMAREKAATEIHF